MRLNHKELERVSAFLREVYAETEPDRFPKTVLAGLARVIQCEHGSFNEIDTRSNRNSLAAGRARDREQLLTESLEWFDTGAVLLDGDGRVVWLSPRAEAFLGRYFPGQAAPPGLLPESLDRWVRSRRAELQSPTASASALKPLLIVGAEARLVVHLFAGSEGAARLLLREEMPDRGRTRSRALGLTRRESEVMQWIIEGKTNPEIALVLGAATRTVHKHVERIFQKLGVQTRAAAVREVLQSL